MIYETMRRMTPKEQEVFDLGYRNGISDFANEILFHKRRYVGQEYDEPYLVDAVPVEVIQQILKEKM